MRAAITAVLPDPAPAITWTGPSGAVIAASCSGVGSWPRRAARTPGVTTPVRVALTAGLHRWWPPGRPAGCRWAHGRPPGRRRGPGRPGDAPGPGTPRPAATWGRWA